MYEVRMKQGLGDTKPLARSPMHTMDAQYWQEQAGDTGTEP